MTEGNVPNFGNFLSFMAYQVTSVSPQKFPIANKQGLVI